MNLINYLTGKGSSDVTCRRIAKAINQKCEYTTGERRKIVAVCNVLRYMF